MAKTIKTVGEPRKLLELCEDEEPISFRYEEERVMAPKKEINMKCVGGSSAAGGRAVVLWFMNDR